MFDCAIIGTGAAGVSAALTLNALNKNFIWFGSEKLSFKIRTAEKIRNYPGFPSVSGTGLAEAFMRHVRAEGIAVTDKRVTGVYPTENGYTLLCDTLPYEAKTVILATGVESVKPIKGELDYVGRGVSYCATCDGFLYKGKKIAVVCTLKELEHEIEYLAALAGKVYAFPLYKNAELRAPNIETVSGMPLEITGDGRVGAVVLKDRTIPVDGVFLLKAAVSPSVLVAGLKTENGHVVINRACETNLSGLFAAGDCTGRPYQYAKAAGEGNVAAHAVNNYLASRNGV